MKSYAKWAAVIGLAAACILALLVQAVAVVFVSLIVLLVLLLWSNPAGVFNRVFAAPSRQMLAAGIAVGFLGVLFGLTWGTASIVIGGVVAGVAISSVAVVLNPWLKNRDEESVRRICKTEAALNAGYDGKPGAEYLEWQRNGFAEARRVCEYYGHALTETEHRWMAVAYILGMVRARTLDDSIVRLKSELETTRRKLSTAERNSAGLRNQLDEKERRVAELCQKMREMEYTVEAVQAAYREAAEQAETYRMELGLQSEDPAKRKPWRDVTADDIRAMMRGGKTQAQIAEMHGVNPSSVSRKLAG